MMYFSASNNAIAALMYLHILPHFLSQLQILSSFTWKCHKGITNDEEKWHHIGIGSCKMLLVINYGSHFKSGTSIWTKFCVGELYLGW